MKAEYSGKLDSRQESRIVELIQRLLRAIASDHAHAEQPTPRRRFVCFLEQLVATRVLDRQKRRAQCHAARSDPDQASGPVQAPSAPTVDSDASPAVPEPAHPQGPTVAHAQDKTPQQPFDLAMHDMAYIPDWEVPHPIQPDQMQPFFGFTEAELMPTFMAFPEQTSSWFM